MKHSQKYPNTDDCLKIMKDHNMLPNIIDHSVQVMNVALAIVSNLSDPDSIDADLITSSALLHDIAKTRTINSGEMRHDLIGGEIIREMGYPDIGKIIEDHVVFRDYSPEGPLEEREIIFYADKRVMHDTVVSLDTRITDLVQRYGVNEDIKQLIIKNKQFILRVEAKIKSFMTCDIDTALKQANLL